MAERPRILIVVNKWWECDPVLLALTSNNARPLISPDVSPLGWPQPLQPTRPRPEPNSPPKENPNPLPRAIFHLNNVDAEVWCVSDLLEHLADTADFQSSSEQKKRYLPRTFRGAAPALVIAVGTAGYPFAEDEAPSENGSVVVGTGVCQTPSRSEPFYANQN